MKATFLSIVYILTMVQWLHSQDPSTQDYRVDVDSYIYFEGYQNVRFKANTSAYGIKGNRFVFDEFVMADVYFNNMTIAPEKKINYDCYFDQVVYLQDGEKYILDKFKVDFIEFKPGKDSSIMFQKILVEEENDVVFMQILYRSKSLLYKRFEKTLVINDEHSAFNYSEKYANEYIITNTYYIQLAGSQNLKKFHPTRREILNLIDKDHRRTVIQFMMNKKINPREDRDLVRLLEFIDSKAMFSSVDAYANKF